MPRFIIKTPVVTSQVEAENLFDVLKWYVTEILKVNYKEIKPNLYRFRPKGSIFKKTDVPASNEQDALQMYLNQNEISINMHSADATVQKFIRPL